MCVCVQVVELFNILCGIYTRCNHLTYKRTISSLLVVQVVEGSLYTNIGYYSPPSFIQVVEANKKEVDEVLASEQDIRRQAGAAASGGSTAGMPGVAAGGGGGGTSTLVNAVDALPALMERKARGDAHLNIL